MLACIVSYPIRIVGSIAAYPQLRTRHSRQKGCQLQNDSNNKSLTNLLQQSATVCIPTYNSFRIHPQSRYMGHGEACSAAQKIWIKCNVMLLLVVFDSWLLDRKNSMIVRTRCASNVSFETCQSKDSAAAIYAYHPRIFDLTHLIDIMSHKVTEAILFYARSSQDETLIALLLSTEPRINRMGTLPHHH